MDRSDEIYFFDIDDTLLMTHPFNERAVKFSLEGLEQYGIDFSLQDAWDFYKYVYPSVSSDLDQMVLYTEILFDEKKELFNNDKNIRQKVAINLNHRFHSYVVSDMKKFVMKFAERTLKKLKTQKAKLGIISQGSPHFQKLKFKNIGLDKYFNSELLFFYDKKTVNNYKNILNEVSKIYPNHKLYMIGDRELKDAIYSKEAGFIPIRIIGDGKYSAIKEHINSYTHFDTLEFFLKNL